MINCKMNIIYSVASRNFRFYNSSPQISSKWRTFSECIRGYCDGPVKYSASQAANWKAEFTRRGDSTSTEERMPWFQPYMVSASITVFLIYFCILREENDVDELFNMSLYDRIEGLEEAQLKASLSQNTHNENNDKILARLKELQNTKKTSN